MGLEVQILRYYLKVFSIICILFISFILFYAFILINNNKLIKKGIITIKKGENISTVINKNISYKNKNIFNILKYSYIGYASLFNKNIHYGKFNFDTNASFLDLIRTITKSSNILNKITIIEGWSKSDLIIELNKFFDNIEDIDYSDILADTYYFTQDESFESFKKRVKKVKENYLKNNISNIFFNKYNTKDIMIIGSLIEKEGLDYIDKRLISSVIINRLDKNMKLQIDATVLYALTNGKYNLNRDLRYKDLKIKHPYNTYNIYGLPPDPISYVGTKTIDIILENYKSKYLFYFYNKELKKHIFSLTYDEHKIKLNDYRKK